MIRESNGVGKVEFSGCLRTDVPSGVEKQKTCGNLRKNPETLTKKQQTKDLLNFTVLDNIIEHFYFTRNQKHLTRRCQRPKIIGSFTILRPQTAQGVWTSAGCANGQSFYIFQQNVSGNEDLSINGCTIP